MQQEPGHTQRMLTTVVLFTAFWLVIIVAFAAQLVFTASFPWAQALRGALFDWGPWVLLSPPVIWLARRFPLELGRLRWSVPVHLLTCFLAIVTGSWISDQFMPRPGPPPDGRPRVIQFRSAERDPMAPPSPRGERPGEPTDDMPPPPPPEDEPGFGPRHEPGPGGARSNEMMPREPGPGAGRIHIGPESGPVFSGPGGPGPRDRDRFFSRGFNRFWAVVLWRRSQFNLPVYWVIVSVVHAMAFYRRVQERDRRALELSASLSKAKLQALRLQMQPHFLFNTLNAISTLVHSDPEKADEMIVNLSELLRLSLDTTDQEVPLRRELELLDRYLAVEQVRLGDRLRVERLVEPVALDALVPALVLQTLVENAVRHGIEPRLAPGVVTLRATRVENTLHLQIADDGVGLKPADRASERRGIGLANTESRLSELYGAEGRMVLREPPDGGVSVEITIPFRVAAAAPAESPKQEN